MDEAAFFVLGVLPYWYTLWLPDKTDVYWLVLCWCCVVWLTYFVAHGQWAPGVNNAVELGLAVRGLAMVRR